MKEVNAQHCGQENALVGFLYGELNDAEVQTFQRHLDACAECSAELRGFKGVRASVVAWRNESLGGLMSSAPDHAGSVSTVTDRKPSALAALREFFNLSPLWMKGALAFASLLFLVFAGLAILRLRETPAPIAANPGRVYSQQQLDAIVSERVQQQLELERARKSAEQPLVAPIVVKNNPERNPAPRVVRRYSEIAERTRRPLSKTEREQLAADLRLTSVKNDSDFDLLGDRINQ